MKATTQRIQIRAPLQCTFSLLSTQRRKPLPYLEFADLRGQVTISSTDGRGTCMSQLIGNNRKRCTRLHELACIGVAQAMEYETDR